MRVVALFSSEFAETGESEAGDQRTMATTGKAYGVRRAGVGSKLPGRLQRRH